MKVEPGGYECQFTTTSGSSISKTHLSPTPWIVGSKPGGHAAGFFLHADPAISTQFLLRAREGSLTYPDELWRCPGAVFVDEL